MMRMIIVVLLIVSRDYHRSAQPSRRKVSEGKPSVANCPLNLTVNP